MCKGKGEAKAGEMRSAEWTMHWGASKPFSTCHCRSPFSVNPRYVAIWRRWFTKMDDALFSDLINRIADRRLGDEPKQAGKQAGNSPDCDATSNVPAAARPAPQEDGRDASSDMTKSLT
jgi:hypothetical protein